MGFDMCTNVQELSDGMYLCGAVAKQFGVKGCCAVFLPKLGVVMEFYTGEERDDFNKIAIIATMVISSELFR